LGSTVASQHVIIIQKKDGLSPLSSHDSQSPPPFFFLLVHLSLMFSTLSFSGRTIGEQPKIKQIKIKQSHYNSNKQTQIRYPRLFLLLPSASISQFSLLPHGYSCDSSRHHVMALDLSRFNLSGALSPDLGHLPPCASSPTSLLPPTSSPGHPRRAHVPLCPSIPLFNLSTLPELWIDLGVGLCVGRERLGGEEGGGELGDH
jgi:hypothetical protein